MYWPRGTDVSIVRIIYAQSPVSHGIVLEHQSRSFSHSVCWKLIYVGTNTRRYSSSRKGMLFCWYRYKGTHVFNGILHLPYLATFYGLCTGRNPETSATREAFPDTQKDAALYKQSPKTGNEGLRQSLSGAIRCLV